MKGRGDGRKVTVSFSLSVGVVRRLEQIADTRFGGNTSEALRKIIEAVEVSE